MINHLLAQLRNTGNPHADFQRCRFQLGCFIQQAVMVAKAVPCNLAGLHVGIVNLAGEAERNRTSGRDQCSCFIKNLEPDGAGIFSTCAPRRTVTLPVLRIKLLFCGILDGIVRSIQHR